MADENIKLNEIEWRDGVPFLVSELRVGSRHTFASIEDAIAVSNGTMSLSEATQNWETRKSKERCLQFQIPVTSIDPKSRTITFG